MVAISSTERSTRLAGRTSVKKPEPKSRRPTAAAKSRLILAALNAAVVEARDVPRLGHNDTFNYDYATAEDMIRQAKKHLAKHELSVLARATKIKPGVGDATAILAQEFSIVHNKHGELELGEREWPIVPGDGRPFDKATAAAHTALLAYFLRDLLQLARSEAGTSLWRGSRRRRARRARTIRSPRRR